MRRLDAEKSPLTLVDSSAWGDFFSASPGPGGSELRRMIEDSETFAITGVVVAEVLQGLTRDVAPIERILAECEMLQPGGFETYRRAAAMYRVARARGVSLTTIDTLIAAIAVEHGASVFTLDQDFSRLALSLVWCFTASEARTQLARVPERLKF
jgi:predicted nucleic acid-binding protein